MSNLPRYSLAPFAPDIALSESVAIVGNSSSLLGAGLGEQIDAHEDVLRFNLARTKTFATDIGQRTTLRLYGGVILKLEGAENAARKIQDRRNVPVLTRPHNKPFEEQAFPGRKVSYFEDWTRAARGAYALLEPFTGLKFEIDRQPRTGIVFMAMLLTATGGAIKPTLFGFDTEDRTGPQWRLHYFDVATKSEDWLQTIREHHGPIEYEWETLLALERRGHIRIVR